MVKAFLEKFPPVLAEVERMLSHNKIFLDRTVDMGVLTKAEALSYGVTGPMLRASGVNYDIRKARPYLSYEQYDFEVPLQTAGDAYARYLVRMAEMRQAIRIIEQALAKLPDGPVSSFDNKVMLPPKDLVYKDMESLIHSFKLTMPGHGLIPPQGEVYSCTESPNGELGFFIVSDGTGMPYRVRVRPPSFYNYTTFAKQATGRLLSDAIACMSSINVIAGELDR